MNSPFLMTDDRPDTATTVRTFYEKYPYPPPIDDLKSYRYRWEGSRRRHANFHLLWPNKCFRPDFRILVAGCGTSQAAKYAIRWPEAQIVGIDFSAVGVRHTEALKRKHGLDNLEVRQLPLELVGDLGIRFDHIACTGVIHHLPDPEADLTALRAVLEPGGTMHLMVYAPYGRNGIYMLQNFFRRVLGPGAAFQDVVTALRFLPRDHPLVTILREAPDFRTEEGLADAFLNPQDRAFSVPQFFGLLRASGLTFGRWFRQAPYSFRVGLMSGLPDAFQRKQLSTEDEFAAAELFRGTMTRHSALVYRDDCQCRPEIHFRGDSWLAYIPIAVPDAVCVQERLPPGMAAVLINRAHSFTDIVLPLRRHEKQLFDLVNGERTIRQIASSTTDSQNIRSLFERLWWHDQIVFDATRT